MTRSRVLIVARRESIRDANAIMRQRWLDEGKEASKYPGWIQTPRTSIPRRGRRLSTLPPQHLIMQLRYTLGVLADETEDSYSIIGLATGGTPTTAQLCRLGAAQSKAARKRCIRDFKQQAEAAYAKAATKETS